jgi:hypothetical protein
MWQSSKNKIYITKVFPLINLLILSMYLIDFDISKQSALYHFSVLLTIICAISLCTSNSSFFIFRYLGNFQISLSTFMAICLVFQLLVEISPKLIPQQMHKYIVFPEVLPEVKSEVLEYLKESPFIKFKPNADISVAFSYARGNEQQFVYKWKTDHLGFKNMEIVSKLNQVEIVAIGDSFVEGMGVAVEDTWPSILSTNGFLTYNLGVQGYAPTQFEGSFKKYGLKLKPKYVIIGYLSTIFTREEAFLNDKIKRTISRRLFKGGISSFATTEGLAKSNQYYLGKSEHFITALYLASIPLFNNFTSLFFEEGAVNNKKLKIVKHALINTNFNPYKAEINLSNYNYISENPAAWENALNSFKNIIDLSSSIDAKVIFLYLGQRNVAYFEKATGEKLPEIYYEKTESKFLQKFAEENNMIFINTIDKVREYVNNIPDEFELGSLPYLEVDGHLGPIGYKLVADEIILVLNKIKNQE